MASTKELVRYTVAVTAIYRVTTVKPENLIVEEIPTEIMEDGYSGKKATIHKKYEVRDVENVEGATTEIYRQEIEPSGLNLVAIINAVNGQKV